MNTPPSIFLSYRRRSDAGYAYALWREITQRFPAEIVFYDRDDHHHLPSGSDWEQRLFAAMDSAIACVVVIGPDWLTACNAHGQRRLDDPADVVRREVGRALERAERGEMRIFPACYNATLPDTAALPADLATLPRHQGRVYRLDADTDLQYDRLIEELAALPGMPAPRALAGPKEASGIFHLIGQPLATYFADPLGHLSALRTLLTERHSAALLAVSGMGGVGKTQLALRYSHIHRRDYHGVWWFRAETSGLLDQDCAALCAKLNISVTPGTLHRDALRDGLASQPPWLLVYDNVEDDHALAAYLPQGGAHHVLLTSRQDAWQAEGCLRLDVWSDEQALSFLRARRPHASDADHAQLNQALGGLPLALEQACAYLEKTSLPLADYLSELHAIFDADPLLDRHESHACQRSVAATLTVAHAHLTEPAQALLHLCAWLAPEPIPEFLFVEHAEQLPPALAPVVGSKRRWRETVAELSGYALCKSDTATLSFHRLTQAAVRLLRREQTANDCGQALELLRASVPDDAENPAHWPRYAALMPHVTGMDAYLDTGGLDRHRYSWLLNQVAIYLQFGPAQYGESERWFRRALTICREDRGEEHPDTLASINNLSGTLKAQGHLAGALDLEKSVLAIRRRVQGEEHPVTLTAMNNLANTLYAQGDLAGALDLEKSALATRRRVLGDEHPATLTAMDNLAGTLNARGDLAGAHELQKSALAIRCRVQGVEHPNTLTAMNNFASTLGAQGNLTGALDLQKSALAICRRVLGEEHPDTLTAMNNLAGTLNARGDLAGARDLEKSALAIRRRVQGEEHPDTLTAMNNFANTLRAQGNLTGALDLQKSALAIRRRVLGEGHPDTLISAWSLFVTLDQLGDRSAAQATLDSHLLPLLTRDPATLGADLTNIRNQLIDMFRPTRATP